MGEILQFAHLAPKKAEQSYNIHESVNSKPRIYRFLRAITALCDEEHSNLSELRTYLNNPRVWRNERQVLLYLLGLSSETEFQRFLKQRASKRVKLELGGFYDVK